MAGYLGRVGPQNSLVTVLSGTKHVIGIAFAIYRSRRNVCAMFCSCILEVGIFIHFDSTVTTSQGQGIKTSERGLRSLKADLHDATLTHVTSLRRSYYMTWDHLHAQDFFFFSYKIKYAKVFARIYGAKVLTNGKQIS